MTPFEINQYFNYHNSNMKLLKIGFDEVRDKLKYSYRLKNKSNNYVFLLDNTDKDKLDLQNITKALSRILSGIQVSLAEESIKRLLYEKDAFTEIQRNYILSRKALDQKWYRALHITFCIAYDSVPVGDETCETINIKRLKNDLGEELVNNYFVLKKIITEYFVPNFSIRNKVQHGEWIYCFEPPSSQHFSLDLTNKIDFENIITTTSRYTLVNAFYQMIVDMARFKSNSFALDSIQTPFEYFYNRYMKKIEYEKSKIENPNLLNFINESIQKEIRGTGYRS